MHILAASLNACVHEHLREGLLLLVEAPVLLPNRLLELLIGTRQVPRQRVGGDARPRGVVSPHEKLQARAPAGSAPRRSSRAPPSPGRRRVASRAVPGCTCPSPPVARAWRAFWRSSSRSAASMPSNQKTSMMLMPSRTSPTGLTSSNSLSNVPPTHSFSIWSPRTVKSTRRDVALPSSTTLAWVSM